MATQDLPALLQDANTQLLQGNIEEGERLLNSFLAAEPNHAPGLDLAARLAMRRGELDAAEQYARRAVALQSVAPFVLSLGEILKAKNKLQKALDCFSSVLKKLPDDLRALTGIGEVYEQADYRNLAIEAYGRVMALDPTNAVVAVKYFGLLPIPDLPAGLAVLDRAKPSPDAKVKVRMNFLHQYVVFREWADRARNGQMPHHSASIDDSFFRYAAADRDEFERLADSVLAENKDDRGGISMKSLCVFSRGDRLGAEPYFAMQAKPGSIYETIAFRPEFYRELSAASDTRIAEGLPPLIEVASAAFSEDHVIYLSCNYAYFVDFARPMLLSLAARGKRPQVHLHIMDGTDDDWRTAKAFCAGLDAVIAISAERPRVDEIGKLEARCYYHAVRFLRLHHHLARYGKTLWLMDVDALINRDPRDMFAQMGEADVAFRARPGRWEPWNQHNASVIAVRPTDAGRRYLRLIASYISHFHRANKLRWGIDQLAMYGVYCHLKDEDLAPRVFLLNNRHVDYEYYDDGFVWCNSGRGKFMQLEQMAKGLTNAADPLRAKYFTSLMTYIAKLK
jgi:tetratricopeptide (TPR) repeat protein